MLYLMLDNFLIFISRTAAKDINLDTSKQLKMADGDCNFMANINAMKCSTLKGSR